MKNFKGMAVCCAIILVVFGVSLRKNEEPKAPVYTVEETVETPTSDTSAEEAVASEEKNVVRVNKGENTEIETTNFSSESLTTGKTVVEGSETTTFVAPEANEEDSQAIEEAKADENKTVEELSEGVVAVTETPVVEETQPVREETTVKVEIPNEVVEVPSQEAAAEEPAAQAVEEPSEDFAEIDFSDFGL